MSSRVQKGNTIFKPVVASRARTVAPSTSQQVPVAQETFAEQITIRQPSSLTRSSEQPPTAVTLLPAALTINDVRTLSEPRATVSAANIIPTLISSRLPPPVLIQVIPHSNTNVQSTPSIDTPAELLFTGLTTQMSDDHQKTAEVPASDFRGPSTSPLFIPMTPPSLPLADSFGEGSYMIHEGTDNTRRNDGDANEKESKRRRTSKRGEGRASERGRSPSEPRSIKTPRPRSRAPSLPPFNPDADPGEDIDPTAVTMAALCVDIGQGRISSKATEIVNNHAAWKLKNREKRARMKAMMEAKKYGRPDDEAEDSPEKPNHVEEHQPSTSTAIPAPSSIAAMVTNDTGNGFDYSQDLTTSRYNVQVRIGPNGEAIIDEDSLVVDRAENQGTENLTHVTESDQTKFVNSASYGKRFRGSRWSAEETELFYDALSQYGENYELIAYVLPGRDRKACKNKFKVEDKKNSARINFCLNNRTPVDISTLSRMTGKDFSGPVPEIRAPLPQPARAAGDGHTANSVDAPLHFNEEHSRQTDCSQSQVSSGEDVIVIGDADGFLGNIGLSFFANVGLLTLPREGKHIAKRIAQSNVVPRQIQLSSREPQKILDVLFSDSRIPRDSFVPAVPVDVTDRRSLGPALLDADVVISLVGIMHGSVEEFEQVQWKGAENVALCAKEQGAKLIHFSAIGADSKSQIAYARTKALGEEAIRRVMPEATIVRPSLVFGPEDDFFNRFARLSRVLPFLPVFGGGNSRFQPVYVEDIAHLVEILSRCDPKVSEDLSGKVIEAGGPATYSYRQLMQLVLKYTGRKRPILSLPFIFGTFQGAIFEKLPVNMFTITRAQVEQLKRDNVVTNRQDMPHNHMSLQDVLSRYSVQPMSSLEEILPTYIR